DFDSVITLARLFLARQPGVCTPLEDVLHLRDDAPRGRLAQPPPLRHMELGAIFAPILKGEQDLVFDREFRRATRLLLCALKFSADDFAHSLESLRLNAAVPLEVCGREGFDSFVAHQ